MKQLWQWIVGLFGGKKKPPGVVLPKPPAEKPIDKPIEIPIPEPVKFHWPDRRAIGMIMLANYQNWTGTDNYMNGDQPFEEWLLQHAKNCITNLKEWNAQGAIIWDSEGTKFPRAYTYYGDPTMTPLKVDPFFKALAEAGFRTGVCLRPDKIVWETAPPIWNIPVPKHMIVADWFADLDAKAQYAKNRWGCTLFYVDSNVGVGQEIGSDNTGGYGQLIPASVFARLYAKHPDCLFIPEWHDADYDLYTAPYWHAGWSNNFRPNNITLVNCADTNWPQEWLNQAVKDGHILMGRAWWGPEIPKIKRAYQNQII